MLKLFRKRKNEQYYVVYVLSGKVMSESKLYKKVYRSNDNQFSNLSFGEWLLECIDRGWIGYAN